MKYLILRDDDTSAVTPINCLERLYRPFLDRGLPINLAVIPDVYLEAKLPNGSPENYLPSDSEPRKGFASIASNRALVRYLRENSCYQIAQHGCHHHFHEFLSNDQNKIEFLILKGRQILAEAGWNPVSTFVAPQDKLSAVAFQVAAKYFPIISTGWFEIGRLPMIWWPKYFATKLKKQPHWRMGNTLLLSRPNSFLSRLYRPEIVLEHLKSTISSTMLTVINTHWWEFFPKGQPDIPFIDVLHQLAEYLANENSIQLISFKQLLDHSIDLK